MQATNGLPEEHLAKLKELSKGSKDLKKVKVSERGEEVLLDLSKLSEVAEEYRKPVSVRQNDKTIPERKTPEATKK